MGENRPLMEKQCEVAETTPLRPRKKGGIFVSRFIRRIRKSCTWRRCLRVGLLAVDVADLLDAGSFGRGVDRSVAHDQKAKEIRRFCGTYFVTNSVRGGSFTGLHVGVERTHTCGRGNRCAAREKES